MLGTSAVCVSAAVWAGGLLYVDAAAALCAAIPLLALVRHEVRRASRAVPVLELAE